jgi:hypothetical protein
VRCRALIKYQDFTSFGLLQPSSDSEEHFDQSPLSEAVSSFFSVAHGVLGDEELTTSRLVFTFKLPPADLRAQVLPIVNEHRSLVKYQPLSFRLELPLDRCLSLVLFGPRHEEFGSKGVPFAYELARFLVIDYFRSSRERYSVRLILRTASPTLDSISLLSPVWIITGSLGEVRAALCSSDLSESEDQVDASSADQEQTSDCVASLELSDEELSIDDPEEVFNLTGHSSEADACSDVASEADIVAESSEDESLDYRPCFGSEPWFDAERQLEARLEVCMSKLLDRSQKESCAMPRGATETFDPSGYPLPLSE